jgi:hypothetical protein
MKKSLPQGEKYMAKLKCNKERRKEINEGKQREEKRKYHG